MSLRAPSSTARPQWVTHYNVSHSELVTALPPPLHMYALPYTLLVYPALVWMYLQHFDSFYGSVEMVKMVGILVVSIHAVLFLAPSWHPRLAVALQFRRVRELRSASHVMCLPHAHQGTAALCPIVPEKASGLPMFEFQRTKCFWDADKKTFRPRALPWIGQPLSALLPQQVDGTPAPAKSAAAAYVRPADVDGLTEKWGKNALDIPVPAFAELLKEHMVAPFFIFQLFCVLLWLFDDMVYYPLMTLVMMIVFECTVVFQRLQSLREFRTMAQKPYPIWVFRGAWGPIPITDLLPGDIVWVGRSEEDQGVPADILLLHGTCIANEALLSGESTPQPKEPIGPDRDRAEALDPEDTDKAAVLFAGTKLLQNTSPTAAELQGLPWARLPVASAEHTPPASGVIGRVLKTGYATTQGKLVRTILFASERVTGDSKEAYFFIATLLGFGLVAAWYVWTEGGKGDGQDETVLLKKRHKLFLHCIMLVTNVVPPELPMQLSLAVNSALVVLSKAYVFCTEPFRIPMAGHLDILCFDKTGTITQENLLLRGALLPAALRGITAPSELLLPPEALGTGGPANAPAPAASLLVDPQAASSQAGGDNAAHWTAATRGPWADVAAAQQERLGGVLVMAAAHGLMMLDGGDIIGDPMERVTLKGVGWELHPGDVVTPPLATAAWLTAKQGQFRAAHPAACRPPEGADREAEQAWKDAKKKREWDWVTERRRDILPSAPQFHIRRRHLFSSALKRMSVAGTWSAGGPAAAAPPPTHWVLCKGAPEVLRSHFVALPPHYDTAHQALSSQGARVLAMGYKYCGTGARAADALLKEDRDSAEKDLHFGGFLVFYCPLKPDSAQVLDHLRESRHRSVMITGDAAFTAISVAESVRMTERAVWILDVPGADDPAGLPHGLVWRAPTDGVAFASLPAPWAAEHARWSEAAPAEPLPWTRCPLSMSDGCWALDPAYRAALHDYDFAVTGPALDILRSAPLWPQWMHRLWVYARMSPNQKAHVVEDLKKAGYSVLMCGDGTNDVGALKQADVGVALLDASEADLLAIGDRLKKERQKFALQKQKELQQRWGLALPAQPVPGEEENALTVRRRQQQERMEQQLADLQSSLMDDADMPQLKFGDASIAAPFTSKVASLKSVLHIIRQGRATLVSISQMYRLIALNSLIAAYTMSILYFSGIKQGDWQATIASMMIITCHITVARAKPLEHLAPTRPERTMANLYFALSVAGQVAIHVFCLHTTRQLALSYPDATTGQKLESPWPELTALTDQARTDAGLDNPLDTMGVNATLTGLGTDGLPDEEAPFLPSLLNSAMYLTSLVLQISTFVVNYKGRPFRESLQENSYMYKSLVGVGLIAVLAALESFPVLNYFMELVPFPAGFGDKMLLLLGIDLLGTWGWELLMRALFSRENVREELWPTRERFVIGGGVGRAKLD